MYVWGITPFMHRDYLKTLSFLALHLVVGFSVAYLFTGSLALAGNMTGRDAPLIARLRAAGGVVLGKTYPNPVVDLKASRREALEAFEQVKH